ncbi:ABC transporter permease [Halorarius halobius]|uniref:ABC transporter permease n=1 Tax=Halorarius halobius TaxID=2962671 RepID=UPI0020CC8EE7|nr:ABC transporter permease subunit [Halorarius halobius]
MTAAAVAALVRREVATVLHTRTYLVLAAAVTLGLLGLTWVAGAAGYVPTALALVTPVELLVPALAFAVGYRAVRGDEDRGELDMLRTFPISRGTYLAGVYLGRAAALVVAVVGSLVAVLLLVTVVGGTKTDVIAAHGGADSVVLFVRFTFLTAVLALVALGMALLVSVVARSSRSALALALVAGGLLVVGLDLALVAGVGSGTISGGALGPLVAFSPASAYRGLVLESVVGAVQGGAVTGVPAWLYGVGLLAWLVAPPALAALLLRWSDPR